MLDEIMKENENLLQEIKQELNIKKENEKIDNYSVILCRIEKRIFNKLIEVAEEYLKIPYQAYSDYASDNDYKQKSTMNYLYYVGLQRKYKILAIDKLDGENAKIIAQKEDNLYDLIYSYESIHSSFKADYYIYKAPKELTKDEIALILDNGNLCFGYSSAGSYYTIYED